MSPLDRQTAALLTLAVLVTGLAGGCVQRRLTVRSNPPGALVTIDNYEVGVTPCSTDYTYYGTRNVRLVRDGFKTLETQQFIPPPWYQVFPLDFVSENLVPYEFRDERALEFTLQPELIQGTQPLLGRAEELRRGSLMSDFVAPPAPPKPTGSTWPRWLPLVSRPTWPFERD